MLHNKNAECRLQIGTICSLRFDYLAVLLDPILTFMIEAGDIAGASLSMQVRSTEGMLKRSKKRHGSQSTGSTLAFWVGLYHKTKGDGMGRMERGGYHKPEIGAYDQNRCLLSDAGAIRESMLPMKTCSIAHIRQLEYGGAVT
jgi:hypothetical protein